MAEIGALDVAWSKPDPKLVVAGGYRLLLGYCSTDPAKNIDAGYLQACLAAGLQVGLVWETTADRVLGGAAAGAEDGKAGEAQANAIGYPAAAVLFFAVDFDAQPCDMATIADYAAAFNQATSRPVGIYGSYAVVEHFVTPGAQPVQFGWQTAAWSGGQLSTKASIYQRAGHVNWPLIPGIAADAFDEDVLCTPLPLAGSPACAAPAPVAAPVVVPVAAVTPAPAPAPEPVPGPAPTDCGSALPGFRAEYGDHSEAIRRLQVFLRDNYPDYAGQLPATGYYGDLTAAAVAEFAHRSGIPQADGLNADGPRVTAALADAGFEG